MSRDAPSPGIHLETQRIVLRRLSPEDADNLYELHSDRDVMHYLTGGVPDSRERIEHEILPRYLSYYDQYEHFGFWAAEVKAVQQFIGWFLFYPYPSAPDETEIGYRLRRSAWGNGYATEASRALIEEGFLQLGVTKVVAETLASNARSRKVMEALGMHLESEFMCEEWELPGWSDEQRRGVKYALTRQEWIVRREQSEATTPSGRSGG